MEARLGHQHYRFADTVIRRDAPGPSMPDSSQNIADPGRSKPLVFGRACTTGEASEVSAEEALRAVYRQILKREADLSGPAHYMPLLQAGETTVKTVVHDLLLSDEWRIRFIEGRSRPEVFIALYDCALSRAPDVEGWRHLIAWEPRSSWPPIIDGLLLGEEYRNRFGDDGVPGVAARFSRKAATPVVAEPHDLTKLPG